MRSILASTGCGRIAAEVYAMLWRRWPFCGRLPVGGGRCGAEIDDAAEPAGPLCRLTARRRWLGAGVEERSQAVGRTRWRGGLRVARRGDVGIVQQSLAGGMPGVHEPAFEHGAFAGRERRHRERARLRLGRVTGGEPLHERGGVAVGAEQIAKRSRVGDGDGAAGRIAVELRGMAARAAVAGAGGAAIEEQRLHLPGEAGDQVGRQVGGPGGRSQPGAERGGKQQDQAAAPVAGSWHHGAGG